MAEHKAGPRSREPTHPGKIAAGAIRAVHLTANAAAVAMHVTPQRLHKVLSGDAALSPEMALRIAALLGSQAEMWLTLQIEYDLFHARKKLKAALANIAPADGI